MKLILRGLAFAFLVATTAANASSINYSGYSVLNNQNVTLNDAALGIANESGGSGEITLSNTNTSAGFIESWCVDIEHELGWSGQFTAGRAITGALGNAINALLTHVNPDTDPNASSALQVAIWLSEYGQSLSVTAPATVLTLANTYLANLSSGIWTANPADQVAFLAGNGTTQDQAYLVAGTPVSTGAVPAKIPEPATLALLLGAALLTIGLACRRR